MLITLITLITRTTQIIYRLFRCVGATCPVVLAALVHQVVSHEQWRWFSGRFLLAIFFRQCGSGCRLASLARVSDFFPCLLRSYAVLGVALP
ncbi:hypothetical protein Cenrod_1000 [Candidatus Symbiobacter mobilis CR]|uniref:Uncharacterized protein n=1 Tax=Candidatus Symbiobacter mobilis CR TaxID=946483 RepID=U5NA85_9BURK|nr:hypothetical protein Cenrod_1000 [Candidatus Symbiobacter mobilis CR]